MDRTPTRCSTPSTAPFARAVLNFKMKFLEMMDDDFNTAGAIGVLHELAGEINAFIERHDVEQNKQPELIAAVAAATQRLRKLGLVLGLFRPGFAQAGSEGHRPDRAAHEAADRAPRNARKDKNFAARRRRPQGPGSDRHDAGRPAGRDDLAQGIAAASPFVWSMR